MAYDNPAKLSTCLAKSNLARQIYYTLSMEKSVSLLKIMNIRTIFSLYHKHCSSDQSLLLSNLKVFLNIHHSYIGVSLHHHQLITNNYVAILCTASRLYKEHTSLTIIKIIFPNNVSLTSINRKLCFYFIFI